MSTMRRKRSTPAAMMACRRSTKRPPPAALMACRRSTKRRRPRAPALAAVTSEPDDASSWAYLHGDLLCVIGSHLLAGDGDLLDYVRFRAVCGHWRSSTASPRGRGIVDPRFHPRRWVMLPEGHGLHPGHHKLRGYVRFFSLSTAAIVRAPLSIFKNHCILDSVDGLLLLQWDHDTAVRLLNPLTGDIAELPPLTTLVWRLPVPLQDDMLAKYRDVSATSFSVSADGIITVMVALSQITCVAFATNRDHQWHLSTWQVPSTTLPPVSLQGKLYLLERGPLSPDSETRVFQIDMPQHDSSPLPPPKLIAAYRTGARFFPLHLVECDSEILLIGATDHLFSHMTVYRLADLILHRPVPVTSIGDNVLLIAKKSLSVSSRVLPNVAGDSILTIHSRAGWYFGQYNLNSATWSPAADGWSLDKDGCVRCRDGIPSPLSLVYHIFTCCIRIAWNKGEIWFQSKGDHLWRVKRKWRQGA